MKIISWNVRGNNGLTKQKSICRKIIFENPSIILIQETKCNNNNLETLIARLWKGSKATTMDANDASEGMALIWNPHEIILNDFMATIIPLWSFFIFQVLAFMAISQMFMGLNL